MLCVIDTSQRFQPREAIRISHVHIRNANQETYCPHSGTEGFLLPEEQIIPTCEETLAGVHAMLDRIEDIEAAH